jgi:hypothetical protein
MGLLLAHRHIRTDFWTNEIRQQKPSRLLLQGANVSLKKPASGGKRHHFNRINIGDFSAFGKYIVPKICVTHLNDIYRCRKFEDNRLIILKT